MDWEIRDETGVIYSGTQEEMQLIWDLITRTFEDLACEYWGTYTKIELKSKLKDIDTDWEGDIELLEVHAIYR